MHGRPREYKRKLQDPKAQEGYRKKVGAVAPGGGERGQLLEVAPHGGRGRWWPVSELASTISITTRLSL